MTEHGSPDDSPHPLLRGAVQRATCPVYHYTDERGLLGILQHRAMWATEAFGLNDVSELRHGWTYIRDWLENEHSEQADDLRNRLPEQNDVDLTPPRVFMCCGSIRGDDAGQWRNYADTSRGYALQNDPDQALGVKAREGVIPDEEPKHDLILEGS